MSPIRPPPSYFPQLLSPSPSNPQPTPPSLHLLKPNPRPPHHSTLPSPLTPKSYNTPALSHLLPYLTLGFTPQPTSSNGLLCALYALVGSLRSARNFHSANGLPLPEEDHITLQNLLDILFGAGRKSVDERTGQLLDHEGGRREGRAVAKCDFEFLEEEVYADENEAEDRDNSSVLEGEVLTHVKYNCTTRYGREKYIGTNFRGKKGTFYQKDVTFHKHPGLGSQYLRAVEVYLEGMRSGEEMDAATIVEVRKGFLNTQVLTDVQVWMVLMVANKEFGMAFGLGVVKSGFQGGWRKKNWVREWEEEIRNASVGDVVFPWKEQCFKWDGDWLVETWVSLHPCFGQKDGGGCVVWIHNNGFEERSVAQCGVELVAHWESMGLDDGEYDWGRKVVDAWGVEELLCKKEDCWRVVKDTVLTYDQVKVVVKRGSFVFWRTPREEAVDQDDGKRYLWVEICGGGDDGWICEDILKEVERRVDGNAVVVEEGKEDGIAGTLPAASENFISTNGTSEETISTENSTTTPTPQPEEEVEMKIEPGTKRKAEEEPEEREAKRGRIEDGDTEQ